MKTSPYVSTWQLACRPLQPLRIAIKTCSNDLIVDWQNFVTQSFRLEALKSSLWDNEVACFTIENTTSDNLRICYSCPWCWRSVTLFQYLYSCVVILCVLIELWGYKFIRRFYQKLLSKATYQIHIYTKVIFLFQMHADLALFKIKFLTSAIFKKDIMFQNVLGNYIEVLEVTLKCQFSASWCRSAPAK